MFVPLKSILPQAVSKADISKAKPPFSLPSSKGHLEDREICAVYPKMVAEILNKKAASCSRALFLRNRILTVEVPSAVWACQLQFVQSDLLKKINELAGEEIVKRVVFRVK